MEQNNCMIKDCFCKISTPQGLRDWTFRAIRNAVYKESHTEFSKRDYEMFFLHIQDLIEGCDEACIGMEADNDKA